MSVQLVVLDAIPVLLDTFPAVGSSRYRSSCWYVLLLISIPPAFGFA